MTLVDELLADLRQCGIQLRLDDAGQIRWKGPRDALTQEFRQRINWLRRDVVAALAAQRSTRVPARISPSQTTQVATDAPTAPPVHRKFDRRPTAEPDPTAGNPVTAGPSSPSALQTDHVTDVHGRDQDDRAGNARRREAKRTLVRSVLHMRPCVDCGAVYPWYVMTLDDGTGLATDVLNQLVHRKARHDFILAWIKRCDAVCLNCYAERAHQRRGPWDGSEFGPWPNGKGNVRWAL